MGLRSTAAVCGVDDSVLLLAVVCVYQTYFCNTSLLLLALSNQNSLDQSLCLVRVGLSKQELNSDCDESAPFSSAYYVFFYLFVKWAIFQPLKNLALKTA